MLTTAARSLPGADPKRGRQDQAAKFRSGCKAREGTNRVLVFCPSETRLCGIMPMLIRSLRTSRNLFVLIQSKFHLKCSTANNARLLSLILHQKVLTIASQSLLCAVASERRRAKWKVKSESFGCGSAWKVADEQDSNRLLELISEIDRLLHEKEMRLRNVRREASKYVIEAEKKAS